MESFLGTIMPVAFNFAPRDWAFCNGQLLPINQNSALFSLLGTTYGGDGVTTFALPDLRGRIPVGAQAQGPGLPNIQMGEMAGAPSTTVTSTGATTISITTANLPSHSHAATFTPTGSTSPLSVTVHASADVGTTTVPAEGSFIASTKLPGPGAVPFLYRPDSGTGTVTLNSGMITASGGGITGGTVAIGDTGAGQPVVAPVQVSAQASTMPPYTGVNFVICLSGIFPPRN